jgi:signal transduction histidine kinase
MSGKARRLVALLLVLAAWGAATGARAEVVELRQARVDMVQPGEPPAWHDTVLPYHWDRLHHNLPGRASFEIPFAFAQVPSEPYGLFFPVVGNGAEIWLNDKLLARFGDIETPNRDDYAKVPRYVAVPPAMLQKENLLRVHIRADGGRRGGLSVIRLGPTDEMRDNVFSHAYAWRVTGSLLLCTFSLVVAFIALTCWATQRQPGPDGRLQRDSVYLWAGVAELCWTLRVGDAVIYEPPLAWPLWGVVLTASYAGWICGVLLFCHHVAGWRTHRSMRWMQVATAVLFAGGVLASWLSFAQHRPVFLTGWLGFATLSSALYACFYFVATLRQPTMARWLVAGAGMLNVAVGMRDWVLIRISDSFGVITWNRYVSVVFGLALLYIVLLRFREASGQARELLGTLAARVAQREQELASTYGRLEQAAREQARTHERERILRDMHDGVGSHISAAIRQLQTGEGSQPELLRTLRDSLDQLKLTIDSIHLPEGDVGALLAALRYRLGPRLDASGIALEWAVDELVPLERLDAQTMRHLQFLLFEAISNVLQHAHATMLRVEAVMVGAAVRLRVIDDGRGYDVSRAPRALRERAQAMGARLMLESRPGRTVVELSLS